MTARQRAMMEKRSEGIEECSIPAEPLLALPTGNIFYEITIIYKVINLP